MISTPDYYRATNEAYKLLIQQRTLEVPINLNTILHMLRKNTRLMTYSQMAARFSMTVYDYMNTVPSEYGFTIKKDDKNYILYNEGKGYYTNRFTIAHEIGHIILGHKIDDPIAKREANCFARNLLCPIPIIDSFHVLSVTDYVEWFQISDLAAEYCIKNKPSDHYYIENHFYSVIEDLLYASVTGESLASVYAYI